jgi:hypothetical protein
MLCARPWSGQPSGGKHYKYKTLSRNSIILKAVLDCSTLVAKSAHFLTVLNSRSTGAPANLPTSHYTFHRLIAHHLLEWDVTS